jgi:hypothetical protein
MERKAWPIVGDVLTESALQIRYGPGPATDLLIATIRADAGGTVISGKVGMQPFAKVFLIVWAALPVALAIGTFLSGQWTWKSVGVLLAFPIFGLGVFSLFRLKVHDHARFLTEFLIRTLDAQELTQQPK